MKTSRMNRMLSASAVALALTLAGCGGGGGTALNMMKDDDPPKMPAPLTLADGQSIGDVEPLLADGTMTREMTLYDGTTFRAYSASMIREFNRGDPNTPSKFSIPDGEEQVKSIRGDGDYGFHITYVDAEGSETTVHFSKDDHNEDDPTTYDKMRYWIWAQSARPFNGENWGGTSDHLAIVGTNAPRTGIGPGHTRLFALYGLETPDSFIDTFEVGATAEYEGPMWAEAYTRGVTENTSGRTVLRGDFMANYEYTGEGAGTVTGMITNMKVQRPGSSEEGIDDTISIVGEARGAQISATMTGTGSEMDGYTGGAVGAAFGPEAEAAAAVFTMERDGDHPHHVLIGSMGGERSTQ